MDCDLVDDDRLELYVMGRLDDPGLSEHLETCERCQARAVEAREYVRDLKRGLEEYLAHDTPQEEGGRES